MIVSDCPKKRKVVTLMSTMHLGKEEEMGSKKNPEVIMYNNSTKSGVDTINQLICACSTKRMTRRWHMAILYNMVDLSSINTLIVYLSLNHSAFESTARRPGAC